MVLVVSPLRGRTARQPRTPPTKEISRASKRKERTTLPGLKPRARIVAISRPRSATAEYMVLRAPKTAPMAMICSHEPAQNRDELGHARGLLGVIVDFAGYVYIKSRIGGLLIPQLL